MSVKIGEMESPNEGLITVFRSLRLVKRLIFMTEPAHSVGLLAWLESD